MVEMDELYQQSHKEFLEAEKAKIEGWRKAVQEHPVLGRVIVGNPKQYDADLVSGFTACMKELYVEHVAARRWVAGTSGNTQNERAYKGFLAEVVEKGGLVCGSLRPLATAMLNDRDVSNNRLQFAVINPCIAAYQHNSNLLYEMGGKGFLPVTRKTLQGVDERNNEIVGFIERSVDVRPSLMQDRHFITALASRCAYSPPGRMTRYHAKLAEILIQSPHADDLLLHMAEVYMMSENADPDNNWLGSPELSSKLEAKFGAQTLMDACLSDALWDDWTRDGEKVVGKKKLSRPLYGHHIGRPSLKLISE